MAIVGIDHVQLAMPPGREAEAGTFYAGVLGCRPVARPEPLASRGGCWFQAGSTQVHLGVEADFRPARKAHPALVVDDLDALAERLSVAGHPFRWDEELPEVRRGFTEDPFGNRVELIASPVGDGQVSGHRPRASPVPRGASDLRGRPSVVDP